MSGSKVVKLPTIKQIDKLIPISEEVKKKVQENTQVLRNIVEGKDDRLIFIVGPCSAWPDKAVIEYAKELAELRKQVEQEIEIVMRVYVQKPRTTIGWSGPLSYPDPWSSVNIPAGIKYCREMMLEIAKLGVPIADELLFTHNDGYFIDLISYLAVGARSTENSEHRYFASYLDMPIGMKNPTSGDINIGVNSVVSAQSSHSFAHRGYQKTSEGNSFAHILLRGGTSGPNYSQENLKQVIELLRQRNVFNPSIIVDASHDNSVDESGKKDHTKQPDVINDVISSMEKHPEIAQHLKGFMCESFLQSGSQKISDQPGEVEFGKSITDGCISLKELTPVVLEMNQRLKKLRAKK